ncbi:MAG: uracil-DNA glycosylase [Anaerolineae bacterium]|jgi:uracil-DNA glycosylase family 4|nr:uracil-DNA glycosylase [Anaerolineae bacterium]MBT3712246.1 uracil-DNA glycosylase [Anaerolineae bacterium]MBT4309937.1 uracil-DNA glycosylase [Anaerolineae bacterium]MBT4456811.1 uracil-DNA glycosylase [Anaerolineae bacterium]MBT6060889.1 uracil-DNA glycosylase [Anaerolineae bacterium]
MTKLETLTSEIIACRKCPRLVEWREEVAITKRKAYREHEYWGKPVPGFGDPQAQIMVVGLAPAAHGSNRTGRGFTGDGSGNFLFPALHRAGFASQPDATARDDGLLLTNMWITSVGRCAPPKNKPTAEELNTCQPFLEREIEILQPKVLVAFGRIAYDRLLKIYNLRKKDYAFSHGALHKLPSGHWLLISYHPSRQNTQTGRLTAEMFDKIWKQANELIA